jgi:hypothetical protein
MKAAAQSAMAMTTKEVESCPLGMARPRVRGLRASSLASSRRFIAIATVRAVTMQIRMRPSWPNFGKPRAARKALSSANGNAKTL